MEERRTKEEEKKEHKKNKRRKKKGWGTVIEWYPMAFENLGLSSEYNSNLYLQIIININY